MADLNGQFDSDKVAPQAPRELLIDGWYAMKAVKSEIRDAASGNGNKYLNFEFEVDETRHPSLKGRRVWKMLHLWNSAKATAIAQAELSAICRSCGVPQITDSEQLHGFPMAVKVAVIPAKGEYQAKNEIKGFATIAEKFSGAAPAQAAAAGATQAAPAATGAAAAPPWAT